MLRWFYTKKCFLIETVPNEQHFSALTGLSGISSWKQQCSKISKIDEFKTEWAASTWALSESFSFGLFHLQFFRWWKDAAPASSAILLPPRKHCFLSSQGTFPSISSQLPHSYPSAMGPVSIRLFFFCAANSQTDNGFMLLSGLLLLFFLFHLSLFSHIDTFRRFMSLALWNIIHILSGINYNVVHSVV